MFNLYPSHLRTTKQSRPGSSSSPPTNLSSFGTVRESLTLWFVYLVNDRNNKVLTVSLFSLTFDVFTIEQFSFIDLLPTPRKKECHPDLYRNDWNHFYQATYQDLWMDHRNPIKNNNIVINLHILKNPKICKVHIDEII